MATSYNLAFLFLSLAVLVSIHVNSGINIFAAKVQIGDKGGEEIEKEPEDGGDK